MKALIVGVGRVGSAVAGRLREAGWEVVVVDESEEALGRLGPNWPGEFHLGHGMDTSVLEQAGIADADAFVASTDGDNTNIVIAQLAKVFCVVSGKKPPSLQVSDNAVSGHVGDLTHEQICCVTLEWQLLACRFGQRRRFKAH